MVQRQNLLYLAIALIVIGAILWGISSHLPAEAVYTVSIVGQIVFWGGIVLLVIWICIVAYHEIKGGA